MSFERKSILLQWTDSSVNALQLVPSPSPADEVNMCQLRLQRLSALEILLIFSCSDCWRCLNRKNCGRWFVILRVTGRGWIEAACSKNERLRGIVKHCIEESIHPRKFQNYIVSGPIGNTFSCISQRRINRQTSVIPQTTQLQPDKLEFTKILGKIAFSVPNQQKTPLEGKTAKIDDDISPCITNQFRRLQIWTLQLRKSALDVTVTYIMWLWHI